MGGRSSKETTVVQDPLENAPDWLLDAIKGRIGDSQSVFDAAKGLIPGLSDPNSVADAPPEWQEALDLIRSGGGASTELLDYAKGALGRDYESDYTDSVVETTLAGMQRQADREALARESANAAIGGTSNTRQAVADALAGQLTGMNMAEMEAKLRDEGFRFGTEMGFEDADLASKLAGQELSQGLQLGGAIGGIGEDYMNVEQEKLNAPKDAMSWLAGMFGNTDPNAAQYLGATQTTTQPRPSTFSQILGAGTSLAGAWLASDERVKEGIEDTDRGKDLDNLRKIRVAEYKYKDGYGHREDRHQGLIAQSLEGISGAVRTNDDGIKEVTPYPILATIVGAVQQLDREIHGKSSRPEGAGL
jgi:hypothetical protein